MDAGRRNECAETCDELELWEDDLAAAVAEGALHPVADVVVVGEREAFERQGGAGAVTGELLEALSVVLVDGAGGVEQEAFEAGAQRRWGWDLAAAAREGAGGIARDLGAGVVGVIVGVVVEPAAAAEVVDDARDERGEHGGDDVVGGRRNGVEVGAGVGVVLMVAGEYAVADEGMNVPIECEGRVEALDERDGSAAGVLAAAWGAKDDAVVARVPSLPSEDDAETECEDLCGQFGIAREVIANASRECDDVLSNGDKGDNAVDEVSGGIVHASCGAGGAQTAALAGECDQDLGLAVVAFYAGEALFEEAAIEVAAQLAIDVRRQATAGRFLDGADEVGEGVGHDIPEGCLLGPTAFPVRERGGGTTEGALVNDRGAGGVARACASRREHARGQVRATCRLDARRGFKSWRARPAECRTGESSSASAPPRNTKRAGD